MSLYTYQDIQEHLRSYVAGGATTAMQDDIRRAVHTALRDVAIAHPWRYYRVRGAINLDAEYKTGTVAFDLTGGAYERLLTLTGGTWPTWAPYGHIRISDRSYTVEDRKSGTELTLPANDVPAADIASGTSYVLYRSHYPLPTDFRTLEGCWLGTNNWDLMEIPLRGIVQMETEAADAGTPRYFAIAGSQDFYGSMAIHIFPHPDATESLQLVYNRAQRPLRYSGYATGEYAGTVSGTISTVAITGSGTSFVSGMVGSVIRFGDTANYPTGLDGLFPYLEQRVIQKFTSGTAIDVDANLSASYSAVFYRVTDVLDLPDELYSALVRRAEAELDRYRGHLDRAAINQSAYLEAVRQAMEFDDSRRRPRLAADRGLWLADYWPVEKWTP